MPVTPNCLVCVHRRPILGSAHSRCAHPIAAAVDTLSRVSLPSWVAPRLAPQTLASPLCSTASTTAGSHGRETSIPSG